MIIPALLTTNTRVAQERINLAKHMYNWLHIDLLDTTLYPHESLSLHDLEHLDFSDLDIEVHCMTTTPSILTETKLPIERIIIHYELSDWLSAYETITEQGIDCWIAIDPATSTTQVELPEDLAGVVLMGVTPGQSGQELDNTIYDRIDALKDRYPDVAVSIDGGVNEGNFRKLLAHGADTLIMASAIFNQPAPIEAYERFSTLSDPLALVTRPADDQGGTDDGQTT